MSRVNGFFYNVEESEILVRNRPKTLSHGLPTSEVDDADAYLSVTDTFVVAPPNKVLVWFPWNEGRMPTPEMYYATNKVLNWWVFYQKMKKIQVFCDGGTHRSVTVFGAFLRTYFDKEKAAEIVKNRRPAKEVQDAIDKGSDASMWAQPLEYIDGYLEDFPADRLLFKAMRGDRLGRLDSHSKTVYDIVRERYADNKR